MESGVISAGMGSGNKGTSTDYHIQKPQSLMWGKQYGESDPNQLLIKMTILPKWVDG